MQQKRRHDTGNPANQADWRVLADALTKEEDPNRVVELAEALSKALRLANSSSTFNIGARMPGKRFDH